MKKTIELTHTEPCVKVYTQIIEVEIPDNCEDVESFIDDYVDIHGFNETKFKEEISVEGIEEYWEEKD